MGDDGFCYIFSMNHTIGDGHTYYMILNQLLSPVGSDLLALQASRKAEFTTLKAMGVSDYAFMRFPFVVGIISGFVFRRKGWTAAYYVDEAAVQAAKAEA